LAVITLFLHKIVLVTDVRGMSLYFWKHKRGNIKPSLVVLLCVN
jgi:hypothetical protein